MIECTYRKGFLKAGKLKEKINAFEEYGFSVIVVIPRALSSFYKPIEKNIICLEELNEQLKTNVKNIGGEGFFNSTRKYQNN